MYAAQRHVGRRRPRTARGKGWNTPDASPSNAMASSAAKMVWVMLSFTVDRTGHVLKREIVRSSGHRELEVISMIERDLPLPPFPASMPQAKLHLTVFAALRITKRAKLLGERI